MFMSRKFLILFIGSLKSEQNLGHAIYLHSSNKLRVKTMRVFSFRKLKTKKNGKINETMRWH